MKLLFLVSFISMNCFSQTILPLSQIGNMDGVYYKDINNQLNAFSGTWKYTNGNTSLSITLQKKIQTEFVDISTSYYEDIIIGEYKYIENGIEKINTLSQFSLELAPYSYSITGNILFGPNDSYLKTGFSQTGVNIPGLDAEMLFVRIDSNGIEKLKLIFRMTEGPIEVEGQSYPNPYFTLPFGEYILIKQ